MSLVGRHHGRTLALTIGALVGLVAGYFRWLDGVVMRIMDGLMAIPGILLAIALISLWRPTLITVIVAITIPEVPRVVRLVRSIVLTIREEPYVEAAISVGTPTCKMLWRHILPNTIAPLIVQGPSLRPPRSCSRRSSAFSASACRRIRRPGATSWPTAASLFQIQFPHNDPVPGRFPRLTVLAINILGDGLRDTLDPKFTTRAVDGDLLRREPRRSRSPQPEIRLPAAPTEPMPSRCQLQRQAGRDRLPGGRIGLGQVGDRFTVMGLLPRR